MTLVFLDPRRVEALRRTINTDPEFKLAARYMSEDVLLEAGDDRCLIRVREGQVPEIKINPPVSEHGKIGIKAMSESWGKLLQASPSPSYTGLNAGMMRGHLQISGNMELAFAYLWALNRLLDIMKQVPENCAPIEEAGCG
jgi:hypothetical protein